MPETLIGTIPDGWHESALGELCASGGGSIQTGPFGSQLHASDYVPVGIPSVMPQNIGDNVIIEDGIARITRTDAARLSRYLLQAGDIIYSRRGDVERRALVRQDQEGWLCGTGCLRVRPGSSADSRFISYFLGHPEIRAWIVRHAIGATMANLNTEILSAVPIVIPPRAVQDSIAAVLGALDDKIAVNAEIASTSFSIAEAQYAQLSLRSIKSIPLGDLISLEYGKSLPEVTRTPGAVPVYGSGGRVGTHNRVLVSGPGIIVGRKGTVGVVYWSEEDFFPIDTTFYVRPRNQLAAMEAVYFALRGLGLDGMNSDSAVPGLNRSNALSLQVRVPAQDDINKFRDEVRPIFALRHALDKESASLAGLRDMLLPKLMSGEIRVREAEMIVEEVT